MSTHANDNDIDAYFSSERIAGRAEAVELSSRNFRDFLIDREDSMLADVRGMDYEEFAADKHEAPFLRDLLDYWVGLYREPFVGITTNGEKTPGLYALPDRLDSDSAPAAAASRLLSSLTAEQREQVSYAIDAPEWRAWSNPEFVVFRTGLRLENQSETVVQAIHSVLKASLSSEGYQLVISAMELNGFLGELVDLPKIMNNQSYWFSLFGTPSSTTPWGWQLHGHHVALNFISVGGRHVIAPVFLGAEPALTEEDRPGLFERREQLALELADSLSAEQRHEAIVYDSVLDPTMPEGRLHPADERHVAGAFRDNRIIPYEGICCSAMDDSQWRLVKGIVEEYLLLLVSEQRALAMAEFTARQAETYFSWYGATDATQPFYFRIHSPVFFAELDHHAGVWLNNRLPARFHVHTLYRLPNGNDYGKAYLEQWQQRMSERNS